MVTIDVVTLRRLRDGLRLLRRPRRCLGGDPGFARSLLLAPGFRSLDPRRIVVIARWDGEPGDLCLPGAEVRRSLFEVQRTHGTLHGSDPLAAPQGGPQRGTGAIFTCGSVRLRKVPAFILANARVVRELRRAPGLREAFGVLGLWRGGPWMCTLSYWDDLDSGLAFAYRSSTAHREAVRAMHAGAFGTRESYFARLRLLDAKPAQVAA